MERILYEKCIDFRKESLLEQHKQMLFKDMKTYQSLDDLSLIQLKKEFNLKRKKLDEYLNKIYFRTSKTKQKLCLIPQIEQEDLRSKYWFVLKSIENISSVLKERGTKYV